jgi:hypothetical protein
MSILECEAASPNPARSLRIPRPLFSTVGAFRPPRDLAMSMSPLPYVLDCFGILPPGLVQKLEVGERTFTVVPTPPRIGYRR